MEDYSVACEVSLDWVSTQQRAPVVLRKSLVLLNLVKDEWDHICLVGESLPRSVAPSASAVPTAASLSKVKRKRKFIFRVDTAPFQVFANQGDVDEKGQFTVALQLEGGTIVHVLCAAGDPPRVNRLVTALRKVQQSSSIRPEELGL